MQTNFDKAQLQQPDIQRAQDIIRKCVHCGICLTACPTYLESGDERNSPRGRIYLLMELLGQADPAQRTINSAGKFMDYCLSCRSCESVCPSQVKYHQLAAIGRNLLDGTTSRSRIDYYYRMLLVKLLTSATLLRWGARLATLLLPIIHPVAKLSGNQRIMAIINSIKGSTKVNFHYPQPQLAAKNRSDEQILLFSGCGELALRPNITNAAEFLLEQLGYNVNRVSGKLCCGALASHSGFSEKGQRLNKRLRLGLDQLVNSLPTVNHNPGMNKPKPTTLIYTSSGCGAEINTASQNSLTAYEISEFLLGARLPIADAAKQKWQDKAIVWHVPCSIRHGLRLYAKANQLWGQLGITVREPEEAEICCGAAGSYLLLQPKMSQQIRARKVANINKLNPDLVVSHNLGCMQQLQAKMNCPILHFVEFIALLCGAVPALTQSGLRASLN